MKLLSPVITSEACEACVSKDGRNIHVSISIRTSKPRVLFLTLTSLLCPVRACWQ